MARGPTARNRITSARGREKLLDGASGFYNSRNIKRPYGGTLPPGSRRVAGVARRRERA